MAEKKSSKTETFREPVPRKPAAEAPATDTAVLSQGDPFVGKTIGNCQILEKMSEGGTALIYRAHNVRFDLDRVVKILKPSLVEEEDFFQRFKQEAQLVARFDHPNIMRVFDTGQVGGYFYIEMEFLEGFTLREYILRNSKINERELLSLVSQMVSALDYAHQIKITGPSGQEINGILHRDIKPENIMITPGKLVKLMDFGAARPLNISSRTMQGMIVGTFHYMSPEQISGAPLDCRSDFFSLGIVLYEMATGQKPFTGENLTELIEKIQGTSYRRVRKLRPSISPLTEELIDRLLSRRPDHRPASAREIAETISHCIGSLSAFGAAPKASIPFSLKRHFGTFALVLSAAALVLSAAAFLRSLRLPNAVPSFADSASLPLLDQGKMSEQREQWNEAIQAYKMVPGLEKGGLANEYLEAQVRMAAILIKYQGQYIKARKVLESLRRHFSDPAIDAYLGRAYFHLGLYAEAQERFDNALKATAGSVIPQTADFKREILYYSAWTIDRRYLGEPQNGALLIEAVKAWSYYIEFSRCAPKTADQECLFALKRLSELQKLSK